jgi:hypothetical protein
MHCISALRNDSEAHAPGYTKVVLKWILPYRTCGCGEKLNHVSTFCSLSHATSTPDHRHSQSCIVEDVETNMSMQACTMISNTASSVAI